MWNAPLPARFGAVALLLLVASTAPAVPFARFETGVDGLSWANAYLLATASGAAYRGRVAELDGETYAEKFRHTLEPLGLEVVAFIENAEAKTGAQVVVARSEAIVLVVFCGTEGHDTTSAVRDWLTDARIWPLEVDGVRVHRGFHQALESVWDELRAAIAEPLDRGLELWLTGHSLGGALANLAAYRLSREGVRVDGVYTFAAPKVGDAELVAAFEDCLGARSQQWAATLDPIPRLPELADRTAFEKLGVTNMLDASGRATLDTELDMGGFPNPLAHRVGSYVNYLYRALPDDVRARLPNPPPLCPTAVSQVGLHPGDGYPLCRGSLWRIRRGRCLERGGEVVEPWCLFEDPGKFRYFARRLKPGRG